MTPNSKHQAATRKKALGLSLSVMLALTGAGHAQAQTPVATPAATTTTPAASAADEVVLLEEVQVKGIRGSAMKAIEVKKNNPQLMEAIVAEDIGKFPDNNVVESLQRVPGIQVTGYGRGQIATVHIRGLPDVTTTVNGRNIFTSIGTAFSLQDMPASLLKQVDVMKTRDSSTIESGIAGVLDIQTNRPFDFAGRKVSASLKSTYHEQGGKYDPNLSAMVSNRWKVGSEGKFGLLLNASYIVTSYRDQSVETGARFPFLAQSGAAGFSTTPYIRIAPTTDWYQGSLPTGVTSMWQAGTDAGLPYGAGSTLRQIMTLDGTNTTAATVLNGQYLLAPDAIIEVEGLGKTKRPAAMLSMQFAPDKNSEYTFEAFYNGYRNTNGNNLLFTQTWEWFNVNPASVTLYPGTNLIKTRTNPNGNVWTSADKSTGKTDSIQYSLAGKWKITPNFNLKSEAYYQKSTYEGTFFAVRTHSPFWDQVSMTMDFNQKDGMPMLKYNNFDPTKSSNWVLDPAWDSANKDKGDALSWSNDATLNVNWGPIKRLKFGAFLDNRKAATASRSQWGFPKAFTTVDTMPAQSLKTITGFFDGRANIPSSWLAIDTDYIQNNPDQFRSMYNRDAGTYSTAEQGAFRTSSQLSLVENWSINELTTAAYLQVDELKVDIAGHKLTGQFGVRGVNINTNSAFVDMESKSPSYHQKFLGKTTITKFLPSLAFNFDITKNFISRLAFSQTLRRPGFGDLNPMVTYQEDLSSLGYGFASGGNPNLKPTESKNLDFSLEYYFNEASMIHATVFRRQIDGLVIGFRKRIVRDGKTYVMSQPDNASDGILNGVELGGKYFPKNLPNVLKGFGLEGSFTSLTSSQDIPITDTAGKVTSTYKTDFYNVSRTSFSTTLAYERSRLSARLSYAWRSEFLAGNWDGGANPRLVYNRPERSVNMQVGVKITEGLSLSLEGTNLTDDIQHSYYGNGSNASTLFNRNNWIVGRTFSASARYSF